MDYPSVGNTFVSGTVQHDGGYQGGVGQAIGTGIANLVSGDLDYGRELEMLGYNMRFNASEAQKNRDWQERLANTAYQRQFADMKAAGLNPYMSLSSGGASTPGGSTASTSSGHHGKSGQALGQLFSLLLGSAFKVMTTSMISEAQMAKTLAQSNSALEVAKHRSYSQLAAAGMRANTAIEVANTPRESHVYHYHSR